MALAAGTRFGPYEILAPLGAGGMGEVYRARDTRLGRQIALKVLPSPSLEDPDQRRRLLREARAASALNHAHIVTVFDVGTEAGSEFVAMELVAGAPLSERLARGPMPVRDAVAVAIQVADALGAAHAAGLVHRDLKPANVMVSDAGAVKLLDFGIASRFGPILESEATLTLDGAHGQIVGTVTYMSPEQAQGRLVDARSDIFSFGSMLWEMIAGTPPFRRDSPAATLAAIVLEEPPPLAAGREAVPPELERLLLRCLRKEPARRIQSAADLRVVLEDVQDELAATTTPSTAHAPRTAYRSGSAPSALAAQRPPHAVDAGGAPPAAPEPTPAPAPPPPADPARNASSARWRLASAVSALIAGLVAGAIATSAWRLLRPEAEPLVASSLTQLTYDDAYAEGPAVSPDGTLVAYASDRAGNGNFDLWVQHISGGDPIRVTTGDGEERQPSFSPDGGHLLYRVEDDGGGLYSIPTFGGAPRLVIDSGFGGRYSPDGERIAYWTGSAIGFSARPGAYRTFVMPATGGSPVELESFTGARFPAWSPDGRSLVVAASRADVPIEDTYDWWIVEPEGGDAHAAGAAAAFRAAGIEGPVPTPAAWIDDLILASAGGQLWAAKLEPRAPLTVRRVERLTFGPGFATEPTISRNGLVAFVGSTPSQNIWALPLDADAGTVRGDLRRLTDGTGLASRATLSADGRYLVYQAVRGSYTVLVKDLVDGKVRDLTVPARPFGPVVSPDGSKVAYPASDRGVRVVSIRGGPSTELCQGCLVGDWTRDSRRIALHSEPAGAGGGKIELVDVDSLERLEVLADAQPLTRPHLTSDDRWLAFRVGALEQATDAERGNQVFIAPFRPGSPPPRSEWIAIGEPERDVRPCGWSPNGRLLYFVSSRDGFRCLYVQPWDPDAGRLEGTPRLVRHFHSLRNPSGGGASVISTGAGNAIIRDQFLLDFTTAVSNVWTLRLPVGSAGAAEP